MPNLSNYELLGEEKIDSSWRNIEFSNYLLEFFGKFARVCFGLSFFRNGQKKPALDCISRVYIKAEDFLSFRTLSALFVLITLLGQFYFPQSMSNNKKPH